MTAWNWEWPAVGPTPISEGLDSEIFDRKSFPYWETFVREAIQNSLDARLQSSDKVCVKFRFHTASGRDQNRLLHQVISYREQCQLSVPEEWQQEEISWLVVQDFYATGLAGDLKRRTSDFWNYWLNFGQSNKQSTQRGGRGIGRVTFLIASRIQTVIGYTRREQDKATPICGMAVLRSIEDNFDFLSTHAYLAESIEGSIYRLHDDSRFYRDVIEGLCFEDYERSSKTGLALAIPYPHKELNEKSILAAAIEHFAPAIIDGTLELHVNEEFLGTDSIESVSTDVKKSFKEPSIREDPKRYIALLSKRPSPPTSDLPPIQLSCTDKSINDQKNAAIAKRIAHHLQGQRECIVDICLSLKQRSETRQAQLRAIVSETPEGVKPFDRFFRGGMCLPKVRSRQARDYDILLFSDDDLLTNYLNLCEGKAHLDLSESKEITQKLRSEGFDDNPIYRVKRLVKDLSRDFRLLLDGDLSNPDLSVFENLFSVPDDSSTIGPTSGTPPSTPIGIKHKRQPFKVSSIKGGIRLVGDQKYKAFPVNLAASIAYADGRRHPLWNEQDFRLQKLTTKYKSEHCEDCTFYGNRIIAKRCAKDFALEITGFDSNRELVVILKVESNAQNH